MAGPREAVSKVRVWWASKRSAGLPSGPLRSAQNALCVPKSSLLSLESLQAEAASYTPPRPALFWGWSPGFLELHTQPFRRFWFWDRVSLDGPS